MTYSTQNWFAITHTQCSHARETLHTGMLADEEVSDGKRVLLTALFY